MKRDVQFRNGELKALILTLPPFCWQTFDEVLSYLEIQDDRIQQWVLSPHLSLLKKQGLIDFKRADRSQGKRGKRRILMYKGF